MRRRARRKRKGKKGFAEVLPDESKDRLPRARHPRPHVSSRYSGVQERLLAFTPCLCFLLGFKGKAVKWGHNELAMGARDRASTYPSSSTESLNRSGGKQLERTRHVNNVNMSSWEREFSSSCGIDLATLLAALHSQSKGDDVIVPTINESSACRVHSGQIRLHESRSMHIRASRRGMRRFKVSLARSST